MGAWINALFAGKENIFFACITVGLLIAIAILFVLLIVARKGRADDRKDHKNFVRNAEKAFEYEIFQRKQVEEDFAQYRGEIDQKNEERKETEKRRRITKSMRQDILNRDEYTCQICRISKSFFDDLCPTLGDYLLLEIDRVNSVANGGNGKDKDNLQVLCWRCNRKKGKKKTNEQVASLIDYGIQYLRNGTDA